MKPWSRFLASALLGLSTAAAVHAAAAISPTGVTVAPGSATPGDVITISIAAANSGAATPADDFPAGGTVTGTVTFTHRSTGHTISTGSVTFTTNAAVAGAGGAGTFTRTFSIPTVTSQAGGYNATVTLTGASSGTITAGASSFTSLNVLTITGKPDLRVTGLTYPAGTAYRGGDVIAMTLSYTNLTSSGGVNNVPYLPSLNGDASFFRIEVILSSNPVFGDGDDFLLTAHHVSTSPLNANSVNTTVNWNQLLPGNFAGSYYVMARIDTLNGVAETIENDLTFNGNNIYYSPDTNASRITLLPTNFPTVYWGSSGGNLYSDNPSVSGDGRYTAFASDSTSLGTNDTNGVRDIFLYDNQTATIRRISLSQQGGQTNAASNHPAISANGTHVAFSSDASNLITSDTNGFSDIYAVNALTGAIARVSVATDGTQANGGSFRPAISASGRYVAFESTATNLIAGGTTVGVTHVYLRDRDVSNSGTFDTPGNVSTVLVSQSTGGAQGGANSIQATISGDGGFVAFASDATNLGGAVAGGVRNIYLRNIGAGTTTLVTTDTVGGAANGSSRAPSINRNAGVAAGAFADGRYIAFGSEASNLIAGDTNGVSDIFVYDRVAATTTRVSLSSAGVQATDPSTALQQIGSINPSISATGRYVAFASLANNLTPGDSSGQFSATDANGALDIFVRDRDVSGSGTFDTGGNVATTLVSVNRFGYQTQGLLGTATTAASDVFPVISGDGRWVAIPSDSENTGGLVHGATNRTSPDLNTFRDIFLHDRRINALPSVGSPPTVAITSPITGTNYDVNSTLTIVASATATTGTIASVQFFVNGTPLGTDTTFPYNASWTPTAVGTFALSAVVTDSFGNQAVSANVNISIAAVSPTAPVVSITSPVTGASLFASGATTIFANATDADGTIASVQFFANGVSIGTDTTFPYSVVWTPVATGTYVLTAVATDNGGNQTTTSGAGSVTVSVANLAAPSVSISSPAAASTVQVNASTTITANASSPGGSVASVQFLANGAALGTATAAPFNFPWTPTVAGSYTLTAIATDNLGSQTTSAGVTVTVSAGAAPTVSIVSPSAGTVVVNTPQSFSATAADADGAIARVDFRVNGVSVGVATAFPYAVTWTPTTTGNYTLQAIATDNLGNQTTSAAVAMVVTSGTAPSVSITAPAGGAALAVGTTTTVTATATATTGTIASVQFFANGVSLGTDTTFPYTASFTPNSNGTYLLTARATDTVGNQTTSAAVTVTVAANAAPTAVITAPANGASVGVGQATTVTGTATDSDGTVTGVQFFANGVSIGTATTPPYSTVWTPRVPGSYALTLVSTDNSGATTTSATVTVTATGGNQPTVVLTAPATGSSLAVNASATVAATATAATGTIASVQFFANGVSLGTDTTFPYTAAFVPATTGTYALTALATDTAGNQATSAAVTVTVQPNVAPTVSVTAPATLGVGVATTLTATAADADGTVASVQFFANGTAIGAPLTAAPYNVNFTSNIAGSISITAVATDNLGTATTSAAAVIAVSGGNAPAVAITAPGTGSTVPVNVAQNVTATATPVTGSIASVEFRVTTGGTTTSLGVDTTFPYAAAWTPAAVGAYTLTAVATDSSGNQAVASSVITVTAISNSGPSITIVSPLAAAQFTAGTGVVLQASASDANGFVTSVRFLVDNQVVGGSLTAAPFTTVWTPTVAGTYSITAIAVDNDFNATTSTAISVTISAPAGTVPTVTITNPLAGAALTTRSTVPIVAGVSSTGVTSVAFYDNGVLLGTDNTSPFSFDWAPSTPGAHRLVAIATAGANIVSSAPVDITVAAATSPVQPTVSLTSPTNGSLVAIGTTPPASVTLAATASDLDGTVSRVEFFVNGTSVGIVTAFPYTFAFTPTSIGSYVVTAAATDNAGNVNTSAPVTFTTVASGAPTVTITTPAAGASVPVNLAQAINATATPAPGRSIVSVQFFANGTPVGTDTTFPYSVNWTPTSPGSYVLTAVATDDLAVPGTSAGVNVTVTPGLPPTGTLTSPAAGANLTVGVATTLTATASASAPATVASVDFRVNGVSVGVDTTFPYSVSYTPPAVGANFSITLVVTDSLGNVFTTPATLVNVTSAPGPTVSVTSPLAGSSVTVGTPTTVTAVAAPVAGGTTVTSVQFFANGVSLGTSSSAPYSVTWIPTAGGGVVLTARATDSNGTSTTSAAVNLTVTTPPASVAITGPVAGSVLAVNAPTTITATATTPSGTVVSVEFSVNGVALLTDTTFPFSAPWTPATPGTFALTARATDNFGTVTTSPAVTVSVGAGAGPTVSISTPLTGSSVNVGASQAVVVNAVAATGTIASVELLGNGVSLGSKTAFPYNFVWTPGGTGIVALTAVAIDTQGNRSVSGAVNVTVAGVSPGAPTVSITAPAGGAAVPVGVATLISATATDTDGTIASVEFFANGQSLGVDTVFPYNVSFTPGATGSYVLTARATDNGGNVATSAAVGITVTGGTAPSVAITSPTDGSTIGVNAPRTITATATSPSGFITSVQFFLNGAALSTDTTFPYSASWTPAALGTYTLTARATDNLGNITDSAVVTVTVGASAAPTIALRNPVDGSSYTVGATLALAADASDSDGFITQVQFFVNGVPFGAPDITAPYGVSWPANSVGVFTLTAQATDNNGNVTASAPVSVTIGANAVPTVALTSPVAGSYSLGNQVLVAATASDSDGTVASVQFFANGLSIGTATVSPFNLSWRPTQAGTFALTAEATDNAGNVARAGPVNVTITSSAAPTVAITNPVPGTAYGVGNAIPFAATTAGGNGPIAQVQFFVNGASLGVPDTISPYAATWTPNAPGTYSLLAIATDSAGLSSSSSASLNITITGNSPPTVALTGPPSGTSVNGGATVNLSAVAADSDGTIASVRFIANGNIVATATALPYGAAWVPTSAGVYTVSAQATDNSGNVTNSTPITITVVGNRLPVVALTAPGNGATVRVGSATNLTATASDPDGTIASVQFFANGLAIGAADTTAPYAAAWTPSAEGIYRLTALALDNSGATALSVETTVLAVVPGVNGADITYTGNYQGPGETGRFAAISLRGRNATFIAFSSTTPSRVYFFSGLPVDPVGGFASFDSLGRTLISGTASDTGASGTLDAGRLSFIGLVGFGSGAGVASGYYTGGLTGRPDSTLVAIVGPDGSIAVHAADGTFRDAGAGTIAATGNFVITTQSGNRFTGRADPATGFLTGTLTGGPGGAFTAAISSGVSFSDGFLRNLSTRGQVGAGSNILIAGFVVAGDSPKQVLVRAIGPSLTAFGVTGALADPQLQLFSGNALIGSNNNWGGDATVGTAANQVGAFLLSPSSLDAAILATLPPGSYTAQVSGVGGSTGIALVELYDADTLRPFSSQKVVNVATRGVVSGGQGQLIAGFVVSGNTAKKLLIRAVGPTLGAAPFNVGGTLADPLLRLVRSDGLVVRENDNWEMGNDAALIADASSRVGAFPLAAGGRDAAMLINVPPGIYSAQVSGPGTTTGVALVEVYEVP